VLTDPSLVRVEVADGVVTLHGRVDRRSTAQIAARLVHGVAGVVGVVDNLSWDYDDTEELRKHYVFGFDPDQGMSKARH
jgi:hypothetical protein